MLNLTRSKVNLRLHEPAVYLLTLECAYLLLLVHHDGDEIGLQSLVDPDQVGQDVAHGDFGFIFNRFFFISSSLEELNNALHELDLLLSRFPVLCFQEATLNRLPTFVVRLTFMGEVWLRRPVPFNQHGVDWIILKWEYLCMLYLLTLDCVRRNGMLIKVLGLRCFIIENLIRPDHAIYNFLLLLWLWLWLFHNTLCLLYLLHCCWFLAQMCNQMIT